LSHAAGLEEVLDAERKVWGFKQFAQLADARNSRLGFVGQEGLLTLQARVSAFWLDKLGQDHR
jgi:hypothetical protein